MVQSDGNVVALAKDGYARTVWTLGAQVGTQSLRVSGTGGTLVVNASTPDSFSGRWEVAGYDSALLENRWNVASYEVHARIARGADTVTVIHHIKRGRNAQRPECRVSVTRTGYHETGGCTLRLRR